MKKVINLIEEYFWVVMILFFLASIIFLYGFVDKINAANTELDVPVRIEASAIEWGRVYGISPEFLMAVAFVESSYDPNAINGNCIGLMQINQSFHYERMQNLGVLNLWDPDQNMHVAADYLAELFQEYNEAVVVLAIYNGQKQWKIDAACYDGYISEYAENILALSAKLEKYHEGRL